MTPGTVVRVHVNLTRGDFTICDPKTRRKIGSATDVVLRNVTFKVSEAVRQSCIAHQARWVHAWATGELVALDTVPSVEGGRKVTYNPFRAPTFTVDGEPIHYADEVTFVGRHGYLTGVVWDIAEGDTVTLPDGTEVVVETVDQDNVGTFFVCTENGESVWYYCADVLRSEP